MLRKIFINHTASVSTRTISHLKILLILFLTSLFITSCGPSAKMRKSAYEVKLSETYYGSMNDILSSETPVTLELNESIKGKLQKSDRIVHIENFVDKSHFDLYKIAPTSNDYFTIEARTAPRLLGDTSSWLIPKLYLFKEGSQNTSLKTSDYTFPEKSISVFSRIIAKIKIRLEENTNYYLLVCSDNEQLLESIYDIEGLIPKHVYSVNTGKYKLKISKSSY